MRGGWDGEGRVGWCTHLVRRKVMVKGVCLVRGWDGLTHKESCLAILFSTILTGHTSFILPISNEWPFIS